MQSIANMKGQRRPLSLSSCHPCDVGYFVFCGHVLRTVRKKLKADARLASDPTQRVASHPVKLCIRHLLPSGWEVMPGIPSAMLTPSDAASSRGESKTLGGSQLLNIANLPPVHCPFVLGSTPDAMCSFHRRTSGSNHEQLVSFAQAFCPTGLLHAGLQFLL